MEMCKVTGSANIFSWNQQYLWKMGQPSALSASQENCSWKHCIAGRISKRLLFTPFKIALLHQPGIGCPQAPCWDSWGGCDKAEGQESSWSRLAPTSFPTPPAVQCNICLHQEKGIQVQGSQASHSDTQFQYDLGQIAWIQILQGTTFTEPLVTAPNYTLKQLCHLSVKISLFQSFQ